MKIVKSLNVSTGIQSQLWTSIVRTRKTFDAMMYPRLLAMAERAWHKASWELEESMDVLKENRKMDWQEFSHILTSREFQRLDEMNVKYHIRPPGARYVMLCSNLDPLYEWGPGPNALLVCCLCGFPVEVIVNHRPSLYDII